MGRRVTEGKKKNKNEQSLWEEEGTAQSKGSYVTNHGVKFGKFFTAILATNLKNSHQESLHYYQKYLNLSPRFFIAGFL